MARWLIAILVLLALPARAQDYPTHPIRVLEPLAAASAVDNVTRLIAVKMGESLGQSLFVDNQPGAAGLLGMRQGAHAQPDGYTVMAVNDSIVTVLPNLHKAPGYDPRKDFVPITLMAKLHWALIAHPSFAPNNLQEFIAYTRAHPGEVNFGSGGQGSPQHLAMELLMRAADIKLTHVPFRGVTQAFTDVIAGHIPVMIIALPAPLQLYADHQIKILATLDLKRLDVLPDIPTIAESGLPGFEFQAWAALMAPAGTPASIVDKLNAAAVGALNDPAIHKQLTAIGYEVVGSTPDQLKTIIAQDFADKKALLTAADIHVD